MKIRPLSFECSFCGQQQTASDRIGVNIELGKLTAETTCEVCSNEAGYTFSIVEILMREYQQKGGVR